jgi:GNAT superfamily N-acetyltransferase
LAELGALESMCDPGAVTLSDTLIRHLEAWLGVWPPSRPGLTVVGSELRSKPGWDGSVRMVLGVSTPDATVLSVPPEHADAVGALGDTLTDVEDEIGRALGHPQGRLFSGVFRWSDAPCESPDRGVWLPTSDPRVLPWLKPFNGDVLVGITDTGIAAGVGRKQHNEWGHELAVVTEPDHRGQGWGKDLVAQAARRVLADGAIPTYLHNPGNKASARTADAAGFPDRGWLIHGFNPTTPG